MKASEYRIKLPVLEDKLETVRKTNCRTWKSFEYKVILKDGKSYLDYKYERARDLFEREGVKLYARTKNLFPIVILIDYKI